MKHLAALLLALAPIAGLAFEPDLPAGARQLVDEEKRRAYYELPLGPFQNGTLETERARGLVRQQSWRIEGQPDAVTEVAETLAAQLVQDGYELVFHCQTDDCGGFDFRFETRVMPPPDMFVDLSNFRFISARRDTEQGPEVVGAMISHTTSAAMVQIISVTPMAPVQLSLVDSEDREAQEDAALDPASLGDDATSDAPANRTDSAATDQMIASLISRGHVVLVGLNFPTGSSNLSDGSYASLDTLAAWLFDNEGRRVALVGHTDSEGTLENNIELSRARAASVLVYLTERLGVPVAQIEAHGIGFLAPIASNAEAEGRDANRRVEAVLLANP